ncbi:hypothetical protein D3C76_761060 [compost metagenome]
MTKASIHAGIAPAKIIFELTVCTPENTRYPRPPPPTKAAIVINPTAVTADILIPAIIKGSDSGNSTFNNISVFVIPIALAASIVSLFKLFIAA